MSDAAAFAEAGAHAGYMAAWQERFPFLAASQDEYVLPPWVDSSAVLLATKTVGSASSTSAGSSDGMNRLVVIASRSMQSDHLWVSTGFNASNEASSFSSHAVPPFATLISEVGSVACVGLCLRVQPTNPADTLGGEGAVFDIQKHEALPNNANLTIAGASKYPHHRFGLNKPGDYVIRTCLPSSDQDREFSWISSPLPTNTSASAYVAYTGGNVVSFLIEVTAIWAVKPIAGSILFGVRQSPAIASLSAYRQAREWFDMHYPHNSQKVNNFTDDGGLFGAFKGAWNFIKSATKTGYKVLKKTKAIVDTAIDVAEVAAPILAGAAAALGERREALLCAALCNSEEKDIEQALVVLHGLLCDAKEVASQLDISDPLEVGTALYSSLHAERVKAQRVIPSARVVDLSSLRPKLAPLRRVSEGMSGGYEHV